jgi:hypothetical protein
MQRAARFGSSVGADPKQTLQKRHTRHFFPSKLDDPITFLVGFEALGWVGVWKTLTCGTATQQ